MQDSGSPLGGPLELPPDDTATPPPVSPHSSKVRRSKRPLVISLVLLVVVALGVGGFMVTRKKSSPNTVQDTTSNTAATQSTTKRDLPQSTGTETYTNDVMRLSITHPDNWTVTDTNNVLRLESPDFTYNTVDTGEVTGNFRIYIRQGAQSSDSTYIGKGVAIVPSEKLVYAQPTETQRKETFLSSFGLDSTDHFAYFLIAGNFELKKGETLGPNFGKEADTFIIGGGYSTKDAKDGLQTNKVPLDEYAQTTAYKQAVDALKSIQIK